MVTPTIGHSAGRAVGIDRGRKPRLKLHYVTDGQLEHAILETGDGTYVCTVERCSEEGRTTFRSRARHLMRLLTEQRGTIIAAGGVER